MSLPFSLTGLSPSLAGLSRTVLLTVGNQSCSPNPAMHAWRFGLRPFRSPLLRTSKIFFLFLRLLRCFSSPGSLPCVMDWRTDTQVFPVWVSPFRNPRISGHVLLPAAYRSLSRLSSALSAKASALCPFCLASSVPACSSVCRRNTIASHKRHAFVIYCYRSLPRYSVVCFTQSTEI